MATTYAIPDGRVAMAATLYTGNGTSQTIVNTVNGVSFAPDLVWEKQRSGTGWHNLVDTVRGVGNRLFSNTTNAEAYAATNLTAFNSNGFSIGSDGDWNTNAATNVAWQWKAGGTAVSNTAGSITSSVSANPTAGFSVVSYTGTGSNATVGHGLGVTPAMIILKPRNSADNWPVWHSSFAVNEYVYLNLTNAKASYSLFMNSTLPTSTVFSLGTWGNVNTASQTMVAYCFAPVAGYSAFGSAVGNGSADGVFVYTGFLPRFILWKKSSSTGDWRIWDSSRSPYDAAQKILYPNGADAEYDPNNGTTNIDFLSNGFKFRSANLNESGATYIYMAFAENPFKYANAR
jgi:hypothetical protein